MQDPLGLVPLGREGTGAAQIFKPFDSSGIWKNYNKAKDSALEPLKDSFGKDISTDKGDIHPNDRWYIEEAKKKYLDKATELYAKSAKSLRPPSQEELNELRGLKQEVTDRLSVAQQMYADNKKQRKLIASAPYAYRPEDVEKVNNRFETKITDRELFLNPRKLGDSNFSEWISKIGDPTVKTSVKRTREDGSSYDKEEVKFDPSKAESSYINEFFPQLNNTQKGLEFIDMIRANVMEADPNFNTYTPEQQVDIIDQAAKNYYITSKKNQYQYSSSVDKKDAPLSKEKGGSSTVKTAEMVPTVSREYVVYDIKTGQRVTELIDPETKKKRTAGVAKKSEGTGIKLVDAITIPIVWNEATPAENRVFQFVSGGQPVVGTPQYLRKHKNSKGEWDKTYSLVVITPKDKDGEPQIKEIPFTGAVKDKLEKEFKVKIEDIESKYGDLKKKAEGLPKGNVEDLPGWDEMPPETQALYRNAWNARYGARTVAPVKAATANTDKPSETDEIILDALDNSAMKPGQGVLRANTNSKASKYIQQYGRK